MHSSEHLSAFMSGFEFMLLAFEGRLHAADLDERSRVELERFVADYKRVLKEYAAGRADDAERVHVLALLSPRLN